MEGHHDADGDNGQSSRCWKPIILLQYGQQKAATLQAAALMNGDGLTQSGLQTDLQLREGHSCAHGTQAGPGP